MIRIRLSMITATSRFHHSASGRPCPSTGAPPVDHHDWWPLGAAPPTNTLGPALLRTIVCSLPAGIVAIVYASQVNTKWSAGDAAGAQAASKNARTWMLVSLSIGLLLVLVSFAFGVLGAIADSSSGDF
jgi:hypothetical protein